MSVRHLAAICCLIIPFVCAAQRRQIGDARTILKSGKNFDKAEKMMTDLLKDSSNVGNLRIYDVWLQAVEKQYEQLNEKMYKKQKVDTVKLFSLVQRMFRVAECLDSLDMQPDKKGRVNLQYREQNSYRLSNYRPNLFFGGAHYVRKNSFQTAFDFFEMYIDCAQQPLFSNYNFLENDPRMGEAAYWATYSGYRLGDPVQTLRYAQLARRVPDKLEYTLQYIAESRLKLHDDSLYIATLHEGFDCFPLSSYFFPRLMDSYTQKGNYPKALQIVDKALEADSLNQLFLYAKSTILLNLGQNGESLKYSERLIELNDQLADAYYNAGTACLNILLEKDPLTQKKQVRNLYRNAQVYMETYRQLAPEEKDKWAPALYRIYFNLNMGKQFDEIDKILKK